MSVLKRIAILVTLSSIAVALAGCNTIEGAGKDMKAAGGAVEKAASKNKGY
jgi:predicted small secreted protein